MRGDPVGFLNDKLVQMLIDCQIANFAALRRLHLQSSKGWLFIPIKFNVPVRLMGIQRPLLATRLAWEADLPQRPRIPDRTEFLYQGGRSLM
jgi:hypothetical protein